MIITKRDEFVIETLTWKGRLMADSQLAAAWWEDTPSGQKEARKRVRRLIEAGFLRKLTVIARPLPSLEAPVAVGGPNRPKPNCRHLARLFAKRCCKPPRSTAVYVATAKAAALTGGSLPAGKAAGLPPGRLKHPLQATHDLSCMQVYLKLSEQQPELAHAWVGEDCAPIPRGRRLRRPDAVICDPSGKVTLAIEVGGSGAAYGHERLEELDADYVARGLPYLLW